MSLSCHSVVVTDICAKIMLDFYLGTGIQGSLLVPLTTALSLSVTCSTCKPEHRMIFLEAYRPMGPLV